MATQRAKRHHLVSAFYLKGFADETGGLCCSPRDGSLEYRTKVDDATVQSDFYSVTAADGSKSDIFERWMGEVEGGAAPVLGSLIAREHPPAVGDGRLALAGWIALQHLRGEAQRGMIAQLDALLRAVQSAGSVDGLDDLMREAVGAAPPSSKADPHQHIQVVRELMPMLAAWIMASPWQVLHLDQGHLVVGDHPVYLAPDLKLPADRGVGLANAYVAMPLARRTLMLVITPEAGKGHPDFVGDADEPTARFSNLTSILNARRAVYRHPEDHLPEPMSSFPPAQHIEVAFEQVLPRRGQ